MSSKTEQILTALTVRLRAVPEAKVERNTAAPERIPRGGLIVLRDGDPGEPEQTLGGIGGVYYSHAVEIEVYVETGEAAARDAAFDALVRNIGAALDADPTLEDWRALHPLERRSLGAQARAGGQEPRLHGVCHEPPVSLQGDPGLQVLASIRLVRRKPVGGVPVTL